MIFKHPCPKTTLTTSLLILKYTFGDAHELEMSLKRISSPFVVIILFLIGLLHAKMSLKDF